MPAGGTWTVQNKVRPGVYINFVGEAKPLGTLGERGFVSLPLPLSWGPAKQVIAVEAGADTFDTLGYPITEPQLLLVREALKRARTLLLYRLNTGTKATATIGTNLTVTAKHGGVRGNDASIIVQSNIDDPAKFDVKTLVSGQEVDLQTVATIEELKSNTWVDFSGTGSLTTTAGAPLTGGADGSVTAQDYLDYLAAIEVHDFNTIGLTATDAMTKDVFVSFAKRLRDTEGKKIQVVMENYPLADYEGVISVKNGVVLTDGTTLTASQAVAWVAGATAGAAPNQSLTYDAYDGAVDVAPKYTNSQIIAALQNGEFLFTAMDGRAIVEQDINTLHTFTPTKGKAFSKNRVIRVLDGLANDYMRVFSQSYIGKVANNDDGRNLFKSEIINITNQYQNIGAVQNFDPQTDLEVLPGADVDAVVVNQWVQPIDSIEKIYMTVTVR
ncbi:phage tail sheath family protein [Thermicanus aegyptius]|uniref:phage tail sheath family protein n=1 Tax=Thermicanus aegyptius TaxID=94009 RepID=UPI00048B7955|nr:phage tail sheath family protein [Thermicanus aegyptius]